MTARLMPTRDEAAAVALLAHRWRVMALPGIRGARLDELVERLRLRSEVAPVSLIELAAVELADETDRICSSALSCLSEPGGAAGKAAVLGVLAVLEPAHKVALYYALPQKRRGAIERHPAWARYVQPWRDTMDEALLDVEQLVLLLGRDLGAVAAGENREAVLRWFPKPFRSHVATAVRSHRVPRKAVPSA